MVGSTEQLRMLWVVLLLSFNLLASTVKAGYGHGGHYKGRLPMAIEMYPNIYGWIYSLNPPNLLTPGHVCLQLILHKFNLCQAPTDSAGMRALAITGAMDMVAMGMAGVTIVESMALVDMLAWATMAAMGVVTMEAMGVVTMGGMEAHQGHMTITKYLVQNNTFWKNTVWN